MDECDRAEVKIAGSYVRKIKVALFVDGNFARLEIARYGMNLWDIDFEKFSNIICEGYYRHFTYYFDAAPGYQNPKFKDLDAYRNGMERKFKRHKVKLGEFRRYTNGSYGQKMVDNYLTTGLTEVIESGLVDKVILMVNDTDFVPVIEKAKEHYVPVILAYFDKESTSLDLRKICDDKFVVTHEILTRSKMEKPVEEQPTEEQH